jgi:lipopolysaccharide transport system permease protein
MMPVIILFLMMISPISYTREMMPPELDQYLLFNPMSWFIFVYRDIMLFGIFPWKDLAVIVAFTLVTFWAGFGLTKRLRPMVFDFV